MAPVTCRCSARAVSFLDPERTLATAVSGPSSGNFLLTGNNFGQWNSRITLVAGLLNCRVRAVCFCNANARHAPSLVQTRIRRCRRRSSHRRPNGQPGCQVPHPIQRTGRTRTDRPMFANAPMFDDRRVASMPGDLARLGSQAQECFSTSKRSSFPIFYPFARLKQLLANSVPLLTGRCWPFFARQRSVAIVSRMHFMRRE